MKPVVHLNQTGNGIVIDTKTVIIPKKTPKCWSTWAIFGQLAGVNECAYDKRSNCKHQNDRELRLRAIGKREPYQTLMQRKMPHLCLPYLSRSVQLVEALRSSVAPKANDLYSHLGLFMWWFECIHQQRNDDMIGCEACDIYYLLQITWHL